MKGDKGSKNIRYRFSKDGHFWEERDFHRRNRSTVGSCVGVDKVMV
jgi:hypothetical protein